MWALIGIIVICLLGIVAITIYLRHETAFNERIEVFPSRQHHLDADPIQDMVNAKRKLRGEQQHEWQRQWNIALAQAQAGQGNLHEKMLEVQHDVNLYDRDSRTWERVHYREIDTLMRYKRITWAMATEELINHHRRMLQ